MKLQSRPLARSVSWSVWLLLVVAPLVFVVLGAACGHAQEEAVAEMERLNKAALAELKKGKAQEARKNLLEAVRVGKEAELTDQPIVARTHVALGAVYAGLKDDDRAAAHMSAALAQDPAIKLPRALASPVALKALRTARAQGEKAAKAGKAKAAPGKDEASEDKAVAAKPEPAAPPPKVALAAPPPPPVPAAPAPRERPAAPPVEASAPRITQPLLCRAPEEAPPENEVFFRCVVRADVRVSRLTLHYRPAGSETFTEVPMARNKRGWYTGAVPAEATSGKSLQYFVESPGPTKVENGSAESPNLIMVREGAAPAGREDPVPGSGGAGEDDAPTKSASEDEDPLAAVAKERERERDTKGSHRRPVGSVFVGLGVGSGYGWQPGGSLEFVKEKRVEAGQLSGGLVTLMPELGYQVSDDFALSLQARLQFIPAQGSGDPRPGSPIERAYGVLARATYASGAANWRGLYSLYAGGGNFRLRVPPTPKETVRSDTVKGGPALAGGGVGFAYHASPHFAWTLELRALVGLPTIAAVADLSTGVEVAF